MSLWRRSGGTNTQLGNGAIIRDIDDSERHELRVCVGPGAAANSDVIVASVQPNGALEPTCIKRIADAVGTKVGIGTGTNGGTATFDSLDWDKHSSPGAEECPDCASTPCPCSTGSDSFDRADSSDIGCFWEEQSGAWEVASNKLKSTATGSVKFQIPNPEEVGTFFVSAKVTATGGAANWAELLLDWDGTGALSRHAARLTFGTSGSGELAIYRDTTKLAHVPGTFELGETWLVSVCLTDTLIVATATLGTKSHRVFEATTPHDERFAGLQSSVASGDVTFDDFQMNQTAGDCASCDTGYSECNHCAGNKVPLVMEVTIPAIGSVAGGCGPNPPFPDPECDNEAGAYLIPAGNACAGQKTYSLGGGIHGCAGAETHYTISWSILGVAGGIDISVALTYLFVSEPFTLQLDTYRWTKRLTDDDCMSIDNELDAVGLPLTACDHTGTVARLKAL